MKTGPVKVLIIDDDPFLSGVYAVGLRNDGLAVQTADNGEKGLEAIRAEKPDVVLLDLIMPGMNGFEVLRRIRANKETEKLPVIVLSSLAQPEDIQRSLEVGASAFLQKTLTLPLEASNKIRALLKVPRPPKKRL